MFDEGQLVRACGQSPILREKYVQSVVGCPSADALPRHPPGDDEEVSSILQHSRSYYYDRLIVTEDQLRALTKLPHLTPSILKKMEPHLAWGVDEHGKFRRFYRIIDDMADNKNSGLRRERVSWTLTNSQERKLLVLQNSLVQGQGSAIFEWAANSDSRMLNESQALDAPTLSAVIGLGQKKSAGKKAADGSAGSPKVPSSRISSAASDDGAVSAAELLKICPPDVPGKCECWIQKNDLFQHLMDAKLKNCIKEAKNLLEKIQGKSEYAANYSSLNAHMNNVKTVLAVTQQNIKDGLVTDDMLQRGLRPIVAIPNGPESLDPTYMFAIVARKVNGTIPENSKLTVDQTRLIKEVWHRSKPWTAVMEVMDTQLETFDDLAGLGDTDLGMADNEDNITHAINPNERLGPCSPFDPFDPKVAHIPNEHLGDRVSMHVQLLVNAFACNMTLKDDIYKDSTVVFAQVVCDELSNELQLAMVPPCFMSVGRELLTPLKQVIFLEGLAKGTAGDTYEERYAEFAKFQKDVSEKVPSWGIMGYVKSSLETSFYWAKLVSSAKEKHDNTLSTLKAVQPHVDTINEFLCLGGRTEDVIVNLAPLDSFETAADNYHKWRTVDKANTSQILATLANMFSKGLLKFSDAVGKKLKKGDKVGGSVDTAISLLSRSLKVFPEESVFRVELATLEQYNQEFSSAQRSQRLEQVASDIIKNFVKNVPHSESAAKEIPSKLNSLEGEIYTVESRGVYYQALQHLAVWTFTSVANIHEENPPDFTTILAIFKLSAGVVRNGIDGQEGLRDDVLKLGGFFQDSSRMGDYLRRFIGLGDTSAQRAKKDEGQNYDATASLRSLWRSVTGAFARVKAMSGFEDHQVIMDKYSEVLFEGVGANLTDVTLEIMQIEAEKLEELQARVKQGAGGCADGTLWHDAPGVGEADALEKLVEMDAMSGFKAKEQKELRE
ncbi:unnamed protein product, partial [Prorocentrum cordatum]